MRRLKHTVLAVTLLTVLGCSQQQAPSPTDPARTIRAFLDAVASNDHGAMGAEWGTSDGPAVEWMDGELMSKRLTIMQIYLQYESYEILPESRLPASGGRQILRVRLSRGGCAPVIPFTVVPYRGDWLVESVDLNAANPTEDCR